MNWKIYLFFFLFSFLRLLKEINCTQEQIAVMPQQQFFLFFFVNEIKINGNLYNV